MSPRRRATVAAFVAALLVLAVLVVVRVVGSAGHGVRQDAAGPVLLLPGYGGDTRSLDPLAAALRSGGRDVVVVSLGGDGTGDLRDQADRLERAVASRLDAGAPSVDVVGYSAGGVVARVWAAELGGAAQARRIVTLGSPHHGTSVASLGAVFAGSACPPACHQLAEGSDLLASLPEAPPGPRWVSLWTAQDETVLPPDSASLEGALDIEVQSVCPDARVTHGQLPGDPLVVGLVARALAVRPLADTPPPTDCGAVRAEGARALAGGGVSS